jgi:hypothetical protein
MKEHKRSSLIFIQPSRDTPQQNYSAEVGFDVLSSQGRTIVHNAKVQRKFRYLLWREEFQAATKLDGLCEVELEGVKSSRYKHWNRENPKFAANLRTWGEAGVVTLFPKSRPLIILSPAQLSIA